MVKLPDKGFCVSIMAGMGSIPAEVPPHMIEI